MSKNEKNNLSDKIQINWFPGHMAKTKRQLLEQASLVDIVYEVIDSRMPISSRVEEMNDIIKDKPKIVIATKYDLCDKSITDKILENEEHVISINLQNDDIYGIINATNELMEGINNKRLEKGLNKRSARVMVIGIPNVGKSTLINRLVGRKVVGVGNKPGVTKNINWIRVNKDIELLDSPGVLWPKFEDQNRALILASFLSIKEEILNSDQIACFILKKIFELYPEKLKERYGLDSLDEDFIEAYETIGKKRGALSKGGSVDYDRVSSIIIRDLNNGYFGDITLDR